VASNEVVSKYEFHEIVIAKLGLDTNLHKPINVDERQLAAKRPRFMALQNALLAKVTGIEPLNLYDMINEEIKRARSLERL
jgi:dTDP-4-dehydrorhamnose reductase